MIFQNTTINRLQLDQITKRITPSKSVSSIFKILMIIYVKWCLVRNIHSADCNSTKIRNVERLFRYELDFEDVKFLVKFRNILKMA